MKRRQFLFTSAIGATAAAMPLATSCKQASKENKKQLTDLNSFPLQECTISQVQEWLKTGKYTSEELVKFYLDRIDAIDKQGPTLRSIIEINPDAIEIARKCDSERKSGHVRSALHGVPVVIKDNIDTADKMATSAGSLALAGNKAAHDAFIVSRLREAGAIILGKTNLSEWANFRSSRSSSGWSGRGGQTRNPYGTDRSPCGSSSGTGVAVAANLCVAGIGTETDGSIVCPSGINGIVGIKPTIGLWSRSGIIPISHSQDTAGPMARSVTDAAIMLGLLAGKDELDETTHNPATAKTPDYTLFLDKKGLQGARIGIARNFMGFHERVDAVMNWAIETLKQQGAEIIDSANIEYLKECGENEFQVLLYEFKNDLNAYLAMVNPSLGIKTLDDLIKYNQDHAKEEMPYFGQELFIDANKKGSLTDKDYLNALKNAKKYAQELGIDATLKKYKLDAIIAPTNGPAWTIDLINGDHYLGGSSTPAACAGYPSITVPAGYVEDLPIGLSFIGAAWSEPQLIKYAYAFEQAGSVRKPPVFTA